MSMAFNGGDREDRAVYSDAEAADLYDVLNPWGRSDDFYLTRIMAAGSVLDVGCGTGALLQRARSTGHTGRLVGVDPDRAALAVARRDERIEWFERTAASVGWEGIFDLAVMTGHAFQCLVTDTELQASLSSIARALTRSGSFVFETRSPDAREWESWNPSNPVDVVDSAGRPLRIVYEVHAVTNDVVSLTESTCDRSGTVLREDRAALRFSTPDALSTALSDADLVIDHQHGGWDGEPLTLSSSEIVTTARKGLTTAGVPG